MLQKRWNRYNKRLEELCNAKHLVSKSFRSKDGQQLKNNASQCTTAKNLGNSSSTVPKKDSENLGEISVRKAENHFKVNWSEVENCPVVWRVKINNSFWKSWMPRPLG